MMESAETGACLWMVTDEKIFGIRVEKLEKLGKNEDRDWKSHLEKAPFDFHLDVPDAGMFYYFFFDSKIFLVGDLTDSGTNIHQISYVGGDTLDISEAVATGAIPPLPTGHYSYFANIKDDVYLVVHNRASGGRKSALWVLRSCSPNWQSASAPPTELDFDDCPHAFVLNDKLFLHPSFSQSIAHVYDPKQPDAWIKLERPLSLSDFHSRPPFVLVSSLGDDYCSVVLTWEVKSVPFSGG